MPEYQMLISLLFPIFVAPIVFFADEKLKLGKKTGTIAFIALLAPLLQFLSILPKVIKEGFAEELYPWAPTAGLTFGLRADYLSITVVLIIVFLCALTSIYSIAYMENKRNIGAYFAAFLLFTSGMVGVVLATNLIEFYLFWELMLVPSYFLIAEWGYGRSKIIAFKYFIFTHVGAIFLLFGILTTYVYLGTFNIYEIPALLEAGKMSLDIQRIVVVMITIGFAVKMALFPVHTWLPDAHAEAPTPISVLLSGVMIKCGAYAFIRIALTLFGKAQLTLSTTFAALAVITMIYGGLMALAQTDIKRLFAYSSVSQMGYIFFGMSVASSLGLTGAIFHVVNHAIGKGLLFMCAGAILHQTENRDIRELQGLAGKMPATTLALMIGGLSLAGTPPFGGFQSEWLIFAGGFQRPEFQLVTAIALISTIITAAYYLWLIYRLFFGQRPQHLENVKEAPLTMLIPMAVLAALAVLFGIMPKLVLDVIA